MYVKHVYGPGGEGTCSVNIDVWNDTDSTKATKVVFNPFGADVLNFMSNMQLGAVVIAETYDQAMSNVASAIMGMGTTSGQSRKVKDMPRPPYHAASTTNAMGSSGAYAEDRNHPIKQVCLEIKKSLQKGSQDSDSDGDISKLHKFLAQDPTLQFTGDVPGHFGSSTEQALKKWQMMHGLATSTGSTTDSGAGFLGPKTRALLLAGCKEWKDDQKDGQNGSTTPQNPGPVSGAPRGLASLAVVPGNTNFEATISGQYNLKSSCDTTQYYLSYGGGPAEVFTSNTCSPTSYSRTHIYNVGTYTVHIDLYKLVNNAWTHYEQAAVLMTVSSSSPVTTKIIGHSRPDNQ